MAGRWDDVTAIADRWIADAEARQGNYLEPLWRWLRGRIALARGDTALALAESAAALELARAARDSQLLTPTLAFRCRVLWEADEERAEEAALEPEARLLAAKDGLSADLPAATDFFREVGAVRWLREAEPLLARTRSA